MNTKLIIFLLIVNLMRALFHGLSAFDCKCHKKPNRELLFYRPPNVSFAKWKSLNFQFIFAGNAVERRLKYSSIVYELLFEVIFNRSSKGISIKPSMKLCRVERMENIPSNFVMRFWVEQLSCHISCSYWPQ